MFVAGRLVGTLITDAPGYSHDRLGAIPSPALLQVPSFISVLTAAGLQPELESTELGPLFAPRRQRLRNQLSYAMLLRADEEVVDFHGRDTDLGSILGWREEPGDIAVRLIVGAGGQGKTRLARELTGRLRKLDWVAGFLADDPPEAGRDLSPVADTAHHTLLVADYAETRMPQLSRLLTLLNQARDTAPIRLLLLARSPGDWWTGLQREYPDLLDAALVVNLPDLDGAASNRDSAFRRAALNFVGRLSEIEPHDWAAVAATLTPPADLACPPVYGSPLTLQMTALNALLQAGPHPIDTRGHVGSQPEDTVLDHERRYWERSASRTVTLVLGEAALSYPVAAAALLGAASRTKPWKRCGG